MHKIKFGERKTPHVKELLFAIKSSDIWVFEKGKKRKDLEIVLRDIKSREEI